MAEVTQSSPSGDMQEEISDSMRLLEEGEESTEGEEVEEDEGQRLHEGSDEESPEGSSEETEEEVEEESEVEEEGEEAKPVVAVTRHRPSPKEITTAYPEFFKKFPDMRHVLFREGEYAQIYPTIDDARTASDDAVEFNRMRDLVTSGTVDDFGEFLSGVKEIDGLDAMAHNFLPALYKQDRDLYFGVTTPVAANLIRNAYSAGVSSGNKDLQNGALHIALWALGDQRYATGELQVQTKAKDKKVESDVDKERKQFYAEKYGDIQSFVRTEGGKRLRAEVRKGLDPNGIFNEYTTELLTRDILSRVGVALEANTRHMGVMNSLWKNAHKAGFAGEWKDRILAAYLSGARAVMPAIRARVRAEALGDQKSRSENLERIARKSGDRREVRGGSNVVVSGQNGRGPNPQEIDWSQTSDMDFLNGKITLKKKG